MGEDILSRCIDFVRKNETVLQKIHDRDARSFQVDVSREPSELWGITWVREEFLAQRRVVQTLVSNGPAERWNAFQDSGAWRIKPGDELVAVNGLTTWEEMSKFKDLLQARLTFVRSITGDPTGESKDDAPLLTPAPVPPAQPPAFEKGGYLLDASGSGWWGHPSGWLFNQQEGVYFHTASGNLFVEDANGLVALDGGALGALQPTPGVQRLAKPDRLRGCIRWFSHKGFGFIDPEERQGLSGDIYAHHSELQQPEGDLPSIPWLPGMPVDFDLSMKDGKPSAVAVRHVLNFHSASDMGFAGGSTARSAGKAAIAMKADTGHTLVGCLGSLVTGHHGMGGADLIALHLAQDLSQGFVGREQGGVKGAKAAMVAGLQNTQQRFMQYAQRLSANSAKIWLTAETHALMALVFGFEGPEAKPCLLLGDVGSEGRALVLHRDGSISQRIGYQGRREEGKAQDALKAFKHGLKGPSISFPPIPGAQMLKEKKGFGAHVKAAVTAQLEVCTLDWTDATLIMASKSFWECLDETQVAGLVTLSSPCSLAESLFEAACARRRGRTMEDLAVVVLRFPWVFVKASPTPQEAKGRKTPKTKKRKVEEVDDIFAPAPAQAEVEQEVDSEESSLEEEEDLPEPRMMAQPKGGLQGATSHDEVSNEAQMSHSLPEASQEKSDEYGNFALCHLLDDERVKMPIIDLMLYDEFLSKDTARDHLSVSVRYVVRHQ